LGSEPDVAFVQEYVGRHKVFRKLAYRGTPDIRVIVFRKVPIMAMLRLPTKESKGRANLHQGAVGVGVDLATGITTRAVWHTDYIRKKPGSNKKLHGIRIPQWGSILLTAVNAQIAADLSYVGADVVLHPEKGPMIIELNAQPGLQIQIANKVGLRRRLDKVEDLEVLNAEHGVNIARALFSERFADRVHMEEGIKTINVWEIARVVDSLKYKRHTPSKLIRVLGERRLILILPRSLG
jgi:alpha-L-glutamate ligase-like protein